MVWFGVIAGSLGLAGIMSIADGLVLKRRGVQLRLVLLPRNESLADQAERWLKTQV